MGIVSLFPYFKDVIRIHSKKKIVDLQRIEHRFCTKAYFGNLLAIFSSLSLLTFSIRNDSILICNFIDLQKNMSAS